MSDLLKIKIKEDCWVDGKFYKKGEILLLSSLGISLFGETNIEIIKALDKPYADKMLTNEDILNK